LLVMAMMRNTGALKACHLVPLLSLLFSYTHSLLSPFLTHTLLLHLSSPLVNPPLLSDARCVQWGPLCANSVPRA
jgi:hypothetical protein